MTAVATLTGADLALWVGRIAGADLGPEWNQGPNYVMIGGHSGRSPERYAPHEDWEQGGPLIEQHTIAIAKGLNQICFPGWHAKVGLVATYDTITGRQFGPTPLIAAMRALVWSVYGDNVPDEVKS